MKPSILTILAIVCWFFTACGTKTGKEEGTHNGKLDEVTPYDLESNEIYENDSQVNYLNFLPTVDCNGVLQQTFTFETLSKMPEIRPAGIHPDVDYNPLSSGEPFSVLVRFDICMDEAEHIELLQILTQEVIPQDLVVQPMLIQYLPGSNAVIQELDSAVFGEFGNLLIQIPITEQEVMQIQGVQEEDLTYVYHARGQIEEEFLYTNSVTVGDFRPGNPFSHLEGKACIEPDVYRRWTQVFYTQTGEVTITAWICESFSFGTYRHTAKEVRVTDPGAPEPYNQQEFEVETIGSAQGESFYLDATVHHNVCTSFRLVLPHADYSFTALRRAGNIGGGDHPIGCKPQVEGAPEISPSVDNTSIFQYQYQGEETVVLIDPPYRSDKCDLPDGCS